MRYLFLEYKKEINFKSDFGPRNIRRNKIEQRIKMTDGRRDFIRVRKLCRLLETWLYVLDHTF